MEERMDYGKAAPGAMRAMRGLQSYVDECGLEPLLLELVKTRASQLNGCAYCVDMHTLDARACRRRYDHASGVQPDRSGPVADRQLTFNLRNHSRRRNAGHVSDRRSLPDRFPDRRHIRQ